MTDLSMAEIVGRTLAERDLTLATSESLTGGQLGATITAVPGASRYYLGGVVVYATEQKARIGGVNPEVLTKYGVVSEQTVVEMVMGVQELTGADYALAASGVAGPDPQEGHPPGEVWIAAIGPRIGMFQPPPVALRFEFEGDRQPIRSKTVDAALEMLRDLLDPLHEG
ncbi:CinA family protein [Micropruina sonneratiae]|uniref:CinA family protein n=1 Tax=Micropruina sonneratiae TaxID=2986940 RepID=UPI002226DFF1|nr:CinA family protein [Micropruina sp. KQZ13P-5]MCW3157887.1 CinA family protein [Micropruina sp. KQZ13P-5]